MGRCAGRCRNYPKCFLVRGYFVCGHLLCYNVAHKFGCCIVCGNAVFRYNTKIYENAGDFGEIEIKKHHLAAAPVLPQGKAPTLAVRI